MAILALSCASSAHADILFYNIFKVQNYFQTRDAQPATPTQFGDFANVNAESSADVTGGEVTSSSPLSPMEFTGSDGNISFGIGLGTKADLDADFPNNATYTFALTAARLTGRRRRSQHLLQMHTRRPSRS
jgi:hypothetical protein